MSLILGIDVGSTLVKAVVFDRRGRIRASAAEPVLVTQLRPGWVERDAEETWRKTAAVIRRVVRGCSRKITAVGLTGCGNGAVFVDRRGRPLRAGILSSDTRAQPFLPSCSIEGGQRPYAGQLPYLLAWLRSEAPALARRLGHALFWKDFIRARLTGVIAGDFTDAGAAGLLAFPQRTLRRSDPAIPRLNESLAQAGEITPEAARVTGLRGGTAVFTGCIDCEAAAIGSGLADKGDVSIVAGTWSINQTYVNQPPRRGKPFLVNPSVQPGRWLVLEGSPSSAANFAWAVSTFGAGLSSAQASAEAARAVRSGLWFIPQVPTGQGAFLGLSSSHARGDLFRAVMEGVAFAHRAHIEELQKSTGRLRRVVVCGGAAASPFWCQLFADVLGCKVDVPLGREIGALGAAIMAGVGAAVWPSLPAAQAATVKIAAHYKPTVSYDCRFAAWRALRDQLFRS